jgi:hypothetical protein
MMNSGEKIYDAVSDSSGLAAIDITILIVCSEAL